MALLFQLACVCLLAVLSVRLYGAISKFFSVDVSGGRGRGRGKDIEASEPSPVRSTVRDEKPAIQAPERKQNRGDGIDPIKDLYFKLQNLEIYSEEVLPQARELLISLFSESLTDAMQRPESGILSIEEYTREKLTKFLQEENDKTTSQWEEYLARRASGSPREMFGDRQEAMWWLKQAAPVKYVDGAWLGHINKVTTPFSLRRITKDAWQVMSEELGDGDLEKNHVHVYRSLMQEIDSGLPEGHTEDFIHPRHELDEERVWKAAIAQLLVSLFPHDFLPESLGFNMAYEGLPLHLMKTVKELQELKLNNYYFVLHISIDNSDSGHSAMAMEAVIEYIEQIRKERGDAGAEQAWKRVQAGFVLAEGLPTTPECASLKKSPAASFPRNEHEAEVIRIFSAKAPVAHKIHCSSKLKIGRRTLVQWLEPVAFSSKQWQMDFLDDLSNRKPWIIKGDSSKSKLIQELGWEGAMFGSFTQSEVEVVKRWIDSLGQTDYWSFVSRTETQPTLAKKDIRIDYPVFNTVSLQQLQAPSLPFQKHAHIITENVNMNKFIPLWFTSPCLLEGFVSIPAMTANETGSAIVRLLRAQSGFEIEGPGVAGMDEIRRTDVVGLVELGLELMSTGNLPRPANLKETLENRDDAFAITMLSISMKPLQYENMLLGLTWAFTQLHEAMASSELLSSASRNILQQIARRERCALDVCLNALQNNEAAYSDFCQGYALGKSQIDSCCQTIA